jgi:hypothetical protein
MKAIRLGLDIQPWNDRMGELMAAGARIIVLRGAGRVHGINPGELERAVAVVRAKIEAYLADGSLVALMYDGDKDDRDRPDIGAVFGELADMFKDNPRVTLLAAQKQSWYDRADNAPITSATGTPYETYIFSDDLPGAHSALTQSAELAEYNGYEQVLVEPVGPIAEAQLKDLEVKSLNRPAGLGPVPITEIK